MLKMASPVAQAATSPIAGFKDEELAPWLSQAAAQPSKQVLVVASGYAIRLLARDADGLPWVDIGTGEFDEKALKAAKRLIKEGRLWWADSTSLPLHDVPADASAPLATIVKLKTWLKEAEKLTKTGREAEASPKTREEVTYLAAWRCQFSGCGKDLRTHLATGQPGRFSYFAHIIAAAPEGPRGDSYWSGRRADDPTNIMLFCDECHRLVDRVNPSKYTTEVLQEMRERSISEVKRLLNSLRYPDVETVVVMGNVTGQPPQFSMRDAEEALWSRELRAAEGRPEWFFQLGGQQHDPHSAGYWDSLFRTLKTDLPRVQAQLNGTRRGGAPRPPLAVFPLHGTSLLVLAGRVLGDASGTHLFQPHRNKSHEPAGTRWAWPVDAPKPAPDKYKWTIRKEPDLGSKEACLLVSLTFAMDVGRLTPECADSTGFLLPTIEISVESPTIEVIRHPDDLTLFGKAVDTAIRTLQDEWGIQKVHLFLGAPTTACVTVGQKMQARNQSTYLCHESGAGAGAKFRPTIEISSAQVREVFSGQSISLQP